MTYWFMNMKQGAEGQDFARELWEQELVGVLFGTWRIDHVLGEDGRPDRDKLTAEAIEDQCPQPKGIDKGKDFNDKFLWAPKTFLLNMSEGDRVVVAFDDIIGIGTVDDEFCDDPNGPRGPLNEHFKCRQVQYQRNFSVAELPASYRLVASMGRRSIQGIDAYLNLVRLLDEHNDAHELKDTIAAMPTEEWLAALSDKHWEVLRDQYLRDEIGLRSLVLGVGGTLKGVDIYGVDREQVRVLGQCKNASNEWKKSRVERLMREIPNNPEDIIYFCCRGGVEGKGEGLDCRVVDGEDISDWLDDNPDYLHVLKTL